MLCGGNSEVIRSWPNKIHVICVAFSCKMTTDRTIKRKFPVSQETSIPKCSFERFANPQTQNYSRIFGKHYRAQAGVRVLPVRTFYFTFVVNTDVR